MDETNFEVVAPAMTDDSDYDKILSEPALAQNYANMFAKYPISIEEKIKCVTENGEKLLKQEQEVQTQLDKHFKTILDFILEAKAKLATEIAKDFKKHTEKLGSVVFQGDELKTKLTNEISCFEQLVDSEQNKQSEDFDYNEDEAIQIELSTSMNEFDETTTPSKSDKVKRIFTNIQDYINQINKTFEEVVDEDNQMIDTSKPVKLVNCTPDLRGLCFGHVERQFPDAIGYISTLDQLDHNKFFVEFEKELPNFFVFESQKLCGVTFGCANTLREGYSHEEKNELYQHIDFCITNSQGKEIKYELKEKIKLSKRLIRAYFTPSTPGVYKLSIQFNKTHIKDSPITFIVTSSPTNLGQFLELIKPEPNEVIVVNNNGDSVDSGSTNSLTNGTGAKSTSITFGRGRLLKKRNDQHSLKQVESPTLGQSLANQVTSLFGPFVSQKRKSPSFDVNNNETSSIQMYEINEDMRELSGKLKKVSVDETANKVHNFDVLSVNTSMDFSVNVNEDACESFVSNHLRRHAAASGAGRMAVDKMPNLRAKLVCKYNNLQFPIGVRISKSRNWVVACDSGNNCVKIFDRKSAKLVHEIDGNIGKSTEFSFHRPSAVLLDENVAEMFIKDDKAITVFDMSQNCKFIRKLGNGILGRPYGLAFNTNLDLVLIDADFRSPKILVLDRKTGKVLDEKPYKPIITKNGASDPKSKIRFLCMNQNSLYASDLGRSVMFKTNLQGEKTLEFGTHGKGVGQINEPSGIHVDYDGQSILVGDSKNDRIQIYDGKGVYKCEMEFIGDGRLGRPSDIHLDSEGYLYVSNFTQHNIKMFKLLDD